MKTSLLMDLHRIILLKSTGNDANGLLNGLADANFTTLALTEAAFIFIMLISFYYFTK